MRSRHLAFAAFLALLSTGCTDILGSAGKTGFIALPTLSDGSGGFVLRPIGAFYGRSDLAFLPANLETCDLGAYAPGGGGIPVQQSLDAGPGIETVLPTRTDTIPLGAEFGFLLYRIPLGGTIPHVPGDSVTVNVPGGPGFPTATARTKTAEAFTHDPVAVPAFGQPINLVWTTPQTTGSVMIVALRYATETSTGTPNEQVFCAFNDDGTGIIPSFLLQNWTTNTTTQRTTVFSRLRVHEVQLGSDTRFTVTSTYEQPLPSATAPPALRQ